MCINTLLQTNSPFDDYFRQLVRTGYDLHLPKKGRTTNKIWKEQDNIFALDTPLTLKDAAKRWLLVSTMSAWSDWHIDAAGLCTMVTIKSGAKLWVISNHQDLNPAS